jgi:O-acetyl-ADP-ribose deacetylase (regulator of RNase III)
MLGILMVVHLATGNMFDIEGAAYVNPVNCLGHPGKGLAYIFAKKYPASTQRYKTAAVRGGIRTGRVYIDDRKINGEPTIIYFPTKGDWHDKSRLEYIDLGLLDLKAKLTEDPIPLIAMPALGCGLGELNFKDIEGLITYHMSDLEKVEISLFPPGVNPKSKENRDKKYVY